MQLGQEGKQGAAGHRDNHGAKQGGSVTSIKGVRKVDWGTGAERSSVKDTNIFPDRNDSTLENL